MFTELGEHLSKRVVWSPKLNPHIYAAKSQLLRALPMIFRIRTATETLSNDWTHRIPPGAEIAVRRTRTPAHRHPKCFACIRIACVCVIFMRIVILMGCISSRVYTFIISQRDMMNGPDACWRPCVLQYIQYYFVWGFRGQQRVIEVVETFLRCFSFVSVCVTIASFRYILRIYNIIVKNSSNGLPKYIQI